MLTCLLLAAGLSERFGSPKALAPLNGDNVIQRVQRTLLASSCANIVVVLGSHALEIQPSIFIHSRIRIVYNKHYNFGQTSSVQEGWRQAPDASEGILVLPVDCPMVKAATIDQMIGEFKKTKPGILIPSYRNKKGHPPIFHQRLKTQALALSKESGLNSLFKNDPPQIMETDDPGVIQSFNTIEEFEELKRLIYSK